jgi:hypothetical protein
MAKFRFKTCRAVYEDYYPPDHIFMKFKKVFIRVISELKVYSQSMWISTL